MKPILIDLFCCAGGATRGYQRAGFAVIGVDIEPQPHYCGDVFIQMDALEFLARLAQQGFIYAPTVDVLYLDDIAAIHASPPCQAHSALTKGNRERGWLDEHTDLIGPTRDFLNHLQYFKHLPYVIENVEGAPIRRDLILCGDMFDLRVIRHRYFELGGWTMEQPEHLTDWIRHKGRVAGMRHGEWFEGPYFAVYGDGGGKGTVAQWKDAMGIDWIPEDRSIISVREQRRLIAEAIPPAYGEFVGTGLMNHILTDTDTEIAS
jgi:DNA (cytosine-5)-methyltransferase 1